MINPLEEELITPMEAASYYPRTAKGKKVHVSKIYRDIQVGKHGVRLECLRTPRLVTSKEAIARFFYRLSNEATQKSPVLTKRNRSRDAKRIERELDRIGI